MIRNNPESILKLIRSRRLRVEQCHVVSNALHRAVPFFDCFAGAMEVEQAQACEPRCDDKVGRLAGEAAAGNTHLYDVETG